MTVVCAMFSGSGMGVSYSSFTQIGDIMPGTPWGQGKIRMFCNVATGNLCVFDTRVVQEKNAPILLGFVYNLQNSSEPWHFTIKSIASFPPPPYNSGTLTLTEEDGHQTVYTYDAIWGGYASPPGSGGAHKVIRHDNASNTWHSFDFETANTAKYDASGLLLECSDATGVTTKYFYDTNRQLRQIEAPKGNVYTIKRDGTTVEVSMYDYESGKTSVLDLYIFDGTKRRLLQHVVGTNCYRIDYEYLDTADRLLAIKQSDSSQIRFNHIGSIAETPRISRYLVGNEYVSSLSIRLEYDKFPASKTTVSVTDLNKFAVCSMDAQQRLLAVERYDGTSQSPIGVTRYQYGTQPVDVGELVKIINLDGGEKNVMYSATGIGLPDDITLAMGQETEYEYDADTGVVFAKIVSLTSEETPHFLYTRYVYDMNFENRDGCRALRFTISPNGRVDEYCYNAAGEISGKKTYLVAYNLNRIKPRHPTLDEMLQWLKTVPPNQCTFSEFTCGSRGLVRKRCDFAHLDTSGQGIYDGAQSLLYTFHNQRGQVTRSLEYVKNSSVTAEQLNCETVFDFDVLGRPQSKTEALGTAEKRVTTYQYSYDSVSGISQVDTTLPNGHKVCEARDSRCFPVKREECALDARGVSQSRIAAYACSRYGESVRTTTTEGNVSLSVSDYQGRLVCEINTSGLATQMNVTGYVYNVQQGYKITTRYGKPVDASRVFPYPDNVPTLAEIPPFIKLAQDPATDRSTYEFYDKSGRSIYSVDEANYLTEHLYDNLDREIGVIKYATALTDAQLKQLMVRQPHGLTPDSTRDQWTQYFYDHDGNKVAEQDPAGYVTLYRVDIAGRVLEKVACATPMPHAKYLAKLTPPADPAHDSHTYYYYDGRSQCVAEIDAEGAMITREFNAAGKLGKEVHHVNKVTGDPSKESDWNKLVPAPSPEEDVIITYDYDRLQRQISRTSTFGAVQTTQYSNMDDIVAASKADSSDRTQCRATLQRYDAWQQLVAQCPPLVADQIAQIASSTLTPEQKAQKIEQVWQTNSVRNTFDTYGLKAKSLDPMGHASFYFYDRTRRPRYTVDARGAVAENIYNRFGDVVATRRYANFLAAEQLSSLTGGYVSSANQVMFDALRSDEKDRVTQISVDKRGLKIQQIDPEGYTSAYERDAFKNCVVERQPVTDKNPSLTILREFDPRGLQTKTTTQTADLVMTVIAEFNNHLGKKTKDIDALGKSSATEYDRVGQPTKTTNALALVSTKTYDPLRRVSQEVDKAQAVTKHLYQQAQRAHTVLILDAAGKPLTQFTEVRNVWLDVIANIDGLGKQRVAVFAPDGQVLMQVDALGNQTIDAYNLCGQRILHVAPDGVITQYIRDFVGNPTQEIFDAAESGAKLTTTFQYNAFGEKNLWQDPLKVMYCQVFERRGLATTLAIDPKTSKNLAALDLLTNNLYLHAQGKLTAVTQGDGAKLDQHLRQVQFDSLGRETGNIVDPNGLKVVSSKRLDPCSQVIAEIDANGKITRYFYDDEGQKRFSVDPLGAVTEFERDGMGRLTCQRTYATAVDPALLTDASILAYIVALAKTSKDDKLVYNYYDEASRLRFTADGLGRVSEKMYNATSREVASKQYNLTIDPATLGNLTTDQLAKLVTPNAEDRNYYRILDDAGQERFALDASGYISEKRFDAAGRTIVKISYAKAVDSTTIEYLIALPAEQVAAKLAKDQINDRITYQVFNAKGDPAYTVDPEGTATRYRYDANGNLTETCIFASKITAPDSALPDSYAKLVALLATLVSDPTKDRITQYQYDKANRKIAVVDALGNTDSYQLDALGKQVVHTDRAGAAWRSEYDGAHRLVREIAPAVDIESLHAKVEVVKAYELDGNSNQTRITFAFGTAEARSVQFIQDAANQPVQIIMDNVPVLGVPQQLSKYTVYNPKKLPIVTVDETGKLHFMVYDSENQLSYEVNGIGAVVKYERNTFGEVIKQTKYAKPLQGLTLTDYAKTGLTQELVSQHVSQSTDDIIADTVYDHRGLPVSIKGKEVFYYIPDSPAPRFGTAAPETRYRYDFTNQPVYSATLIDPQKNVWAEKVTWFDRAGHKIAETDELQRLKRYQRNAFGDETARTEFATFLPLIPTEKTTVAELDVAIKPNPADRHYAGEFDLLGQKTAKIRPGMVIQVLTANDTGPVDFSNTAPLDLVERYQYSKTQQVIATTHEDGSTDYVYFNLRGDKIAATEVPRQTIDVSGSSLVTLTPLTYFGVNCHGQTVQTKMFHNGTAEAKASSLPTPVATDGDDRVSMTIYDIRGLPARTIDPEGVAVDYLYTATRQVSVRRQQLTNFNGASTQPVLHNIEQRYAYDDLGNQIANSHAMDGQVEYTTAYQFNIFGQQTGEGSGDGSFPAFRSYVGGHVYVCTDDGTPTIQLYNLAGQQTAALKSVAKDLTQIPYSQLGQMLSTWGTDPTLLERREMYRDPAARVYSYNTTPPYGRPDPTGIQDMPINLVASSEHSEIAPYSLSWFHILETTISAPTLAIWPKSNPAARRELPIIEQIERMGADISAAGLPSDVYAYEINYYQKDPRTGAPDIASGVKYRTEGVVQLDTGISQNSTALVPVVREDQQTVKLVGKTSNLGKVELWQDGKYLSVVALQVDPKTKEVIVDLSPFPSGIYQLKPYYAMNPAQLADSLRTTTPKNADELTLPFIVHTTKPAAAPLGQGIDCYARILTLDTHGQIIWTVPTPFLAQPIKITCEYLDASGITQIQEDMIVPGTSKGEYTDDNGDKLVCNTEFKHAPAKIKHFKLALKIGTDWITLVNEDTYVPPPPSVAKLLLGKSVTAEDEALLAADPHTFTPKRAWQLYKARFLQKSLARRVAAERKKVIQAALDRPSTSSSPAVTIEAIDQTEVVSVDPGIIQQASFLPTSTLLLTPVANLSTADTYRLSYLDLAMDRMAKWKPLDLICVNPDSRLIALDVTVVVTGVYPFKLEDLTSGQTIIQNGTFTLDRGLQVFSNDPIPPIQPIMTAPLRYIAYNAWDQETKLTDTLGNATDKAYNTRGQLMSVTAPQVGVFDEHGTMSIINPTTTYGYDCRGIQIGVRDANGHVTAARVNAAGQTLVRILGDGTHQYAYSHDCFGQEICHRDCRGHVWTKSYNHSGAVVASKMPSLRTNYYGYNELGIRRDEINAAGFHRVYNVNSRGYIVEAYQPMGEGTYTQYDRNHQPLVMSNPDGTLTWQRDYFGRELQHTDLSGAVYTPTYDYKGQLIAVKSAGGNHCNYLPFNPFGSDLVVGKETTTPGQDIRYDIVAGQVRVIHDSAGKTVVKAYDTENRPTTKSITWWDGTLLQNISTQYDSQGRIVRSDDVNATFYIGYDPAGNRRFEGGTVYVDGSSCGRWDWFLYDGANRVTTDRGFMNTDKQIVITDDQGTRAGYDYNGDYGDFRTWEEKAGVGRTSLIYDDDGRLTKTQSSLVVVTWDYDSADRVYHYDEAVDGKSFAGSVTDYNSNSYIIHSIQAQDGNSSESWFDGGFTASGTASHQLTKYSGAGNVRDDLHNDVIYLQSRQLRVTGGTRHVDDDNADSPYSSVNKYFDPNGVVQAILGADREESNGYIISDESGQVLMKWRKVVKNESMFVEDTSIIHARYIYDINGRMLSSYTASFDTQFCRCSFFPDWLAKFMHYNTKPVGIDLHQHSFAPGIYGAGHITDMHLAGDYFQDVSKSSADARTAYALKQSGTDKGVVVNAYGMHIVIPNPMSKFRYSMVRNSALKSAHTDSQISGSFMPSVPQMYTPVAGETFASISQKVFGYEGYAGIIAEHNGWSVSDTPEPGRPIEIPQLLPNVNPATASTPYERFVSLIIGSMAPHLETPQNDDDDGCNPVVMVLAVVVVAIVTWGVGSALAPAAGGAATAGTAGAGATAGAATAGGAAGATAGAAAVGTAATATATVAAASTVTASFVAETALAYAVGGAVASAVEQGLAIGFGFQSGFSVRNMLESGLASGLTAGVMTGFGVNPAAGISTSNMMGAAKAAITVQLAEMALGMRSKFDIGQVIVETAGYGVSAKFGQTTGFMTYAKDAVRAISDNVISSIITGHRLDLTSTAAEFAGMAAQDAMAEPSREAARQKDAKANATQEDGKSDARSSVAPTKDKTTVDARGRTQAGAGAGAAGGGGGAGSGNGADSSMSADDDSATSPAPSRRSGNGAGSGRASGGGLFSDNPDTRSALAASSKRLATQANQSSLALRATDYSDVVSDVHTPDAYQDAARDVLYQMTNDVVGSVTSPTPASSGGSPFWRVVNDINSFGDAFTGRILGDLIDLGAHPYLSTWNAMKGTAQFAWDMGNAASGAVFGLESSGSLARNTARLSAIQGYGMAFASADTGTRLAMIGDFAGGLAEGAVMGGGIGAAAGRFGLFGRVGSGVVGDAPLFRTGSLSAADANASFIDRGWNPPYADGTRARVIQLQQANNDDFVRVHVETNQAREWVMRKSEIAGMSAAQIRDAFAIPTEPIYISDVHVPSSSYLQLGTAAPQAGWGSGGAMQYQVLSKWENSWFINRTPIDEYITQNPNRGMNP